MKTLRKIQFVTKDIVCVFCGVKTGQFQVPLMREHLTQEDCGFVDSRCPTHEIEHGNFKAMTEEFHAKTGKSFAEAEIFVKQNRKQADFNNELEKELNKK